MDANELATAGKSVRDWKHHKFFMTMVPFGIKYPRYVSSSRETFGNPESPARGERLDSRCLVK